MADIIHKIRIEASPQTVFNAISTPEGFKGWYTIWTSYVSGNGEVGSVIRIGFGDNKYGSNLKITKLDKDKSIELESLDENDNDWSWKGTKLKFQIKEEVVEMYGNKKMTVVDFSHLGLKDNSPFLPEFNTRWGFFLLSLKEFIEKGKGSPVPDDIYM